MKRSKWIVVAVSPFIAVGNAQDAGDATTVPVTPTGNFYGSQGNVATNRSLAESELNRAAEAARQKKALMAAMASQSLSPEPVYTSAEAFLAANKPNWPSPPPREPDITDASSPAFGERRERIAPTLPDAPRQQSAPVPQFEPQKKPGLFDRLLKKESDGGEYTENPYESVPAANYEDSPSLPPAPAGTGPEESVARDAAMLDAVSEPDAFQSPGQEPKTGIFGKLFKRDRNDMVTPESIPTPEPQAGLPPEMVEAPAAPAERVEAPIPEPEPFEAAASEPAPAPEPAAVPTAPMADIFSRRANADTATSETATITSESQADVGGVLVTLYEGTTVGVISRDGGTAKIRLQDQRVGTVDASALR